ncbi:protein of unknown function [Vibrio tapetis subsp. tapetis]|uniref:Uncharacterized protein n=1 Tax=Vibrio tapetis subsp. tapetis TaxID=1671868 RepID=A0A2N8ZAP2_9VIBR|nr:protein of unknown function [Vibrio tapetis subsp. tapetis]
MTVSDGGGDVTPIETIVVNIGDVNLHRISPILLIYNLI